MNETSPGVRFRKAPDRRRSRRLPVSLTIELKDAYGFSFQAARDLSPGGAFFDRAIPHPVGQRLAVSFTLPTDPKPFVCMGEVVNVPDQTRFGMGVRFLDLEPGETERLASLIRQLEKRG
jgi:hypothetical protein